jgi:hypothetical protein
MERRKSHMKKLKAYRDAYKSGVARTIQYPSHFEFLIGILVAILEPLSRPAQ